MSQIAPLFRITRWDGNINHKPEIVFRTFNIDECKEMLWQFNLAETKGRFYQAHGPGSNWREKSWR